MEVEFVVCPHCKSSIIPKTDNTCPNCQLPLGVCTKVDLQISEDGGCDRKIDDQDQKRSCIPKACVTRPSIIFTKDRKCYRRWINLFPSILIPGLAQFLAGHKTTGVLWFIGCLLMNIFAVIGIMSPQVKLSKEVIFGALFIYCLIVILDGFRYSIPKQGIKGWIYIYSIYFCLILLPILELRQFALEAFRMPTSTMPKFLGSRSNLKGYPGSADRILANKLIYRLSEPKRGDVIVFSTTGLFPVEQNVYYVKRLVGLPNETIRINPPYVLVNGSILEDPPIFQRISSKVDGYHGYTLMKYVPRQKNANPTDTITLGSDEYFVMGDNSEDSLDSRHYGPIKRSAIHGKAFYIYDPVDRKGKIE